jgi:hypothetical protein
MIHINSRCKSALLALSFLIAGQTVVAVSLPAMPSKSQVAGYVALAMYIRLQTKGSSFKYKSSDWSNDVENLVSSLNVFNIELYENLIALFDKWCVGRKLKIEPVSFKTTKEDGTVVTVKDKKVQVTPFGAMGLFDAYIIGSLENFAKIAANLAKSQELTKGVFGIDFGYSIK